MIEDRIEQLLDAVPFDATDLPGYAVRVLDFNRAHPSLVRLLLWHHLERPGVLAQLPQTASSHTRKVAAMRAGARRRRLGRRTGCSARCWGWCTG